MNHFTGMKAIISNFEEEVVQIQKGVRKGESTVIHMGCGGYKYDHDHTAIGMTIMDPITLLDGDQLKDYDLARMASLVEGLSEAAKELKCTVMFDNGVIWSDCGVEELKEAVIKFGRQHKTVALSCGKPLSAIKDGLLADVYDLEVEAEKTHKPAYLPPKESWKQGRLRRGPGHNKHSRKEKKK